MGKKGKILISLLLVIMICALGVALSACGEEESVVPTSIIENNVQIGTSLSPLPVQEFEFSKITFKVRYSDGSTSGDIKLTESMVTNLDQVNSTISQVKQGYLEKTQLSIEAKYTARGKTLTHTFIVHIKAPEVTFTVFGNGAANGDISIGVPIGKTFNSYDSFISFINEKAGQILQTGYNLQSIYWLNRADYTPGMNETDFINNGIDIKSENNWASSGTGGSIASLVASKDMYFWCTWTRASVTVTFNYNFNQYYISNASFYHRTYSVNKPTGTGVGYYLEDPDGDRYTLINAQNQIVTEVYTQNIDKIQRPTTYVDETTLGKQPWDNPNTPMNDIVEGRTFVGWYYLDADGNKQTWSFNNVIRENMTFYAEWADREYTITFDLGGGYLGSTLYISDDGKLLCENTSSVNSAVGTIDRMGTLVDTDGTSKSVPTVVSYTGLTYRQNVFGTTGKNFYLTKTVNDINANHYIYKGKISEGQYYYEFAGWYLDANFTQPFSMNANEFTKDLYLYAKWELVESKETAFYTDYLFKGYLELKDDGTYKITGVADKTITTLRIPTSIGGKAVTEIGARAFSGCSSLLNVEFVGGSESRLEKIGDRAFEFCSRLSLINKVALTIPGDVGEDILSTADDGASALRQLGSLTSVGVDVFKGTAWLTEKKKELNFITFGNLLVQYIGDTSVTNIVASTAELPKIGEELDTSYTLTEIKNSEDKILLYQYTSPTHPTYKYVVLGDNIATINDYAFKGLTSLTSFTVPSTVTYIGDYAFSGCDFLRDFNIVTKGGTVYSVRNGAGEGNPEPAASDFNLEFVGSSALVDTLFIDEFTGFVKIGKILYAYRGSNTVTQITIPAGIEIIADNLFISAQNLRVILFEAGAESSIKKIGRNAFNSTRWYSQKGTDNNGFVIINNILIGYTRTPSADEYGNVVINVPNGVVTIASYAFSNTSSITHITLPPSVQKIEDYAFESCTKLKSISFEHIAQSGNGGYYQNMPVLFDDGNITENSFSRSTTDSMVSPSLKLFFTNDLVNGESCYTFAINNHSLLKLFHSTVKPDGDENAAFINELRVTDVRVKEGTVPTEYVATTGWSIRSYWMQQELFNGKAKVELLKSDGLIYSYDMTLDMISGENSSLTHSSEEDKAKYGYDIYNGTNVMTVTYTDANGVAHSCDFAYTVRPEISSVTVDAPVGSYMKLAVYYTTSQFPVYEGGLITINYSMSSVQSQTVSISKLMENNKLDTDKDVSLTIKNFSTGSSSKVLNMTFAYQFGEQLKEAKYEYVINELVFTKIEAKEPPIEFDISSVVDKGAQTDIILIMSRNDPLNGGQIYAVDNEGALYSYGATIPDGKTLKHYIFYYMENNEFVKSILGVNISPEDYASASGHTIKYIDTEGNVHTALPEGEYVLAKYALYNTEDKLVEYVELSSRNVLEYLYTQEVAMSDGKIYLYKDSEFKETLRTFDTSVAGVHKFYARYMTTSGLVAGSELSYKVILRTSQALFGYEVDEGAENPMPGETVVKDENDNVYTYGGVATVTSIQPSHYTTVSVPEYFTRIIQHEKIDEVTGEVVLDEETGEPVIEYEYVYYVVVAIGDNAFKSDTVLQELYIGKYVTSIGNNAFANCVNLTSIKAYETGLFNVKSIGISAFENCTALASVGFNGIETIGEYAFKNSGLTSFDFSLQNVTEIEAETFYNCKSLATVNLTGVEVINNQAFWGCSAISTVTIPASVRVLGDYVFSACVSLVEVILEATDPTQLYISDLNPFGTNSTALTLKIAEDTDKSKAQEFVNSIVSTRRTQLKEILTNAVANGQVASNIASVDLQIDSEVKLLITYKDDTPSVSATILELSLNNAHQLKIVYQIEGGTAELQVDLIQDTDTEKDQVVQCRNFIGWALYISNFKL